MQRCARCGSILHLWHERMIVMDPEEGPRKMTEDDIPWFEPGDMVAKSEDSSGINMYVIDDDRPLEKHERECVSLTDLFNS